MPRLRVPPAGFGIFTRRTGLLCPLLTSAPRSGCLAASSVPGDTVQISRSKPDSLRRTPAGFTVLAIDGYGLCDILPARPTSAASYPVSVRRVATLLHASFRRSLAVPPPASAGASSCALLVLHLHQVAQGTFTPKLSDMSDTQDALRRLRRCRRIKGGILDCRCARRSTRRQVGTKGWRLSIKQRDGRRRLTRRRRPEPRSWGRTASAVRAGCRPPTASGQRRCAGRGRGCGRAGAARHNGGG